MVSASVLGVREWQEVAEWVVCCTSWFARCMSCWSPRYKSAPRPSENDIEGRALGVAGGFLRQ